MAKKRNINLGEVAKRASSIIRRQKAEFAATFKAAHGDKKKIAEAAKQYRKKYGATPSQRRKNALKLAAKHSVGKQTSLNLK